MGNYTVLAPSGQATPTITPTPSKHGRSWRAVYFSAHRAWDVDALRLDDDGNLEGESWGRFSVLEDLQGEDAILIAAAHDLRDALEKVLSSDMAQREEDEGRVSETLNLCRAALAKARVE